MNSPGLKLSPVTSAVCISVLLPKENVALWVYSDLNPAEKLHDCNLAGIYGSVFMHNYWHFFL
jgi:hypothetical protein